MDSETECSNSNLEEEKEVKGSELKKLPPFDAIRVENNGEIGFEEYSKEDSPIGEEKGVETPTESIGSTPVEVKVNGERVKCNQSPEPPQNSTGSPSNSATEVASSKSTPPKGYGLKKWRRIRRDLSKDGAGGGDSSQILKRRLSANDHPKARDDSKLKSDGEGETETPVPSVGSPRSVEAAPLDLGLGQLVPVGGFSFGADSDNSEDRSSKSSTAASVPKPRHEIGFGRERGRMKNLGGRGSGNVLQQRGQRGRGGGGTDASKKFRGDQVRLEMENSQSSVESDLRSSNVRLVRRGSGVSNGKQSGRSLNFDGENSDDGQTCDEVRSGYYKENGGVDNSSKDDLDPDLLVKEHDEKSENHWPPLSIDPVAESVDLLQAAQEALETEIQKFGKVGKESSLDDSDGQFEEAEVTSSLTPDAHIIGLNQKIEHLEHKLEEVSITVKAKESKVHELEAILSRTHLSTNESKVHELEAILSRTHLSTNEKDSTELLSLEELRKEMEFELESMLKKKIEAEIEFLIITRTSQSWKVLAEDQIALFQEQKSLAGDQAQMALKLRDAENKAIKLKEQAEELELYCKELLGTENILKLQSKVCKFSMCCFIQLLLLCIAFGLFLIQLLPPSNEVVPT